MKYQCRATTRRGERCKQPAIAGGVVCRYHGGAAPQVRAAASRRLALAEARTMLDRLGVPADVTPEDGLIDAIRESAGNVELLRGLVAELDVPDGTGPAWSTRALYALTGSASKPNEAAPHVLVGMYNEERDRFVAYCRVAIAAGLEARRVALAERDGERLASLIRAVCADDRVPLTADGRAVLVSVFADHLRSLA